MPQPSADAVTKVLRGRIDGAADLAQELLSRKEYTAETSKRPAAHNHENELPSRVVLTFDLHQTLTPDFGFPLVSPPFPGVKAFMDLMVSRNACMHIASASLDRSDPQIIAARKQMIWAWAAMYGLPIGWVGPNVDANVRLDDRGVTIPMNPDWGAISKQAQKRLLGTWLLDEDTGVYIKRPDIVPVGNVVTRYPEITDAPDDQPRGWSTPMLDIDIHRTINPGWGSTREDEPVPGAVAALQRWYDQGYQIQLSCAGWMRSTHTQAQTEQRLAAFRLYFRKYGIPYDRIVTKDDCELFFDDKVIQFTTYKQSAPLVDAALALESAVHPVYMLPHTYQRSESASAAIEQLGIQIKALEAKLAETPKVAATSPDIHIHFPEGMVQAPVTIADGAIRNESHFAAPGGESVFTYDGEGRVTGVRRK